MWVQEIDGVDLLWALQDLHYLRQYERSWWLKEDGSRVVVGNAWLNNESTCSICCGQFLPPVWVWSTGLSRFLELAIPFSSPAHLYCIPSLLMHSCNDRIFSFSHFSVFQVPIFWFLFPSSSFYWYPYCCSVKSAPIGWHRVKTVSIHYVTATVVYKLS